jgi:Rieske 2Fe-2S family protein
LTTPIPNAAPYNGLKRTERTLPTPFYVDPAHHADELRAIFYRHWLYVGRAETVEKPLAWRTFEIGDQSVILVRDEAGTLRAFHNTCRHRGSRLVDPGAGTLSAKCITCRYHAWTYGLDGSLLRVFSQRPAEDFDKADYPLYEVALKEWRGFLFVNLAGDAAFPFEDAIRRNWSLLENWPFETMRIGHVETIRIACNWKLFWENNSECLHCPGVHPELCERVPIFARGLLGQRDDPDWRAHADSDDPKYRGGLREGAVTLSLDGKAHGATFPDLSEAERRNGQNFLSVLPGLMLIANLDYARVHRIRPLDVAMTEVEMSWLFPPETLADGSVDIMNNVAIGKLVLEQDARVCEINQAGLSSLRHEAGVLLPEEHLVKRFQDWVKTELGRR